MDASKKILVATTILVLDFEFFIGARRELTMADYPLNCQSFLCGEYSLYSVVLIFILIYVFRYFILVQPREICVSSYEFFHIHAILSQSSSATCLPELDRLSLSRDEINSIVSDSMKFLAGLEFVLRDGVPQEKLVATRQCVKKIVVDRSNAMIKLSIYLVPVGNLEATRERTVSL